MSTMSHDDVVVGKTREEQNERDEGEMLQEREGSGGSNLDIKNNGVATARGQHPDAHSSSSDESSSDEDGDLVLAGVANEDESGESTSDEESDNDDGSNMKPPAAKKSRHDNGDSDGGDGTKTRRKTNANNQRLSGAEEGKDAKMNEKKEEENGGGRVAKKRKKGGKQKDDLEVEFVFCDMNEKFFHGMKTLLLSNPIHAVHSSELSDLMIDNVSVGTVVSTEGSDDVFGFASILNCTTNGDVPCIKSLKEKCLEHCPKEHRKELQFALSGETRRPAGFFVNEKMINSPLQLTEVLHQQIILDLDWAVENAEGGEEERKSLDFGAFVIVAPCTQGKGGALVYKYFDDEIFASHAEFTFSFDAPQRGQNTSDDKPVCSVIVLTKTGHRDGVRELTKMISQVDSSKS